MRRPCLSLLAGASLGILVLIALPATGPEGAGGPALHAAPSGAAGARIRPADGAAPAAASAAGSPASIGPTRTFQVAGVTVDLAGAAGLGAPATTPEQEAPPRRSGPGTFIVPALLEATPFPPVPVPPAGPAPVVQAGYRSIPYSGWFPPDTQGVAGPAHFVAAVNTLLAVFDKGSDVPRFVSDLRPFFSPVLAYTADLYPFDPRVIYDQYAGRFILVADAGFGPESFVLVAVSRSNNPLAGFHLYRIDANGDSTRLSADYPNLAVDPRSILVTNNMFKGKVSFVGFRLWVIDKATALEGGPMLVREFDDPVEGSTWVPAHTFGDVEETYLVSEDHSFGGTSRLLRVAGLSYPSGSPVIDDRGYVRVWDYGFDPINSAPQLGCDARIDEFDYRVQNAVLRHGRLWVTHHVDDPVHDAEAKTEVAWYEIDPRAVRPCGRKDPCVVPLQQGRISDPSIWYYYPSLAVNAAGEVGIGFSGSSALTYAGAYLTVRHPGDPPGAMREVGLLRAGVSSYIRRGGAAYANRWGDFSQTSVDPLDDLTFWTAQEYADQERPPGCPTDWTGWWGTWRGRFR